jgi:hypothetical protein
MAPPDENNHLKHEDDHFKLSMLAERQRQMLKRLDEIEKKQQEAEKLVNRYMGGIALLIGVGLFIGWLFTVGSNVWHLFE